MKTSARRNAARIALLALLLLAIAAFFLFDLGGQLTLANVKAQQARVATLLDQRPWLVIGAFFALYVGTTALSLPGAAILTLAAGALFGLGLGTLIVSFASVIGASLAFLSARFILRDWVQARFGERVAAIDRGIEKEGALYLLSLRLIPLFPFFLINLAMGLTKMRLATFFLVSQVGMLPGTLVFVNAGTQLAAIDSSADILSPALIGSFVLLGLFPLLAKWLLSLVKRRRVYRGFRRPRRFDRNLIVIGAGAGGLVTAYIAAAVRARVTLVEAREMGGDCLNTGCVPSKALIRSARAAHELRTASDYGIEGGAPRVDFPAVMARIRQVIATIAPADSVERYSGLGVDVRTGHATIVDPWTVEIRDAQGGVERLTARSIVIAAGAEPFVPPIPGLAEVCLTSDSMWDALEKRDSVPARMVIVGGGPIGIELAQAFARLGSAVTVVEAGDRILPNEEPEVSSFIADALRAEGVDIRTGHSATRCEGKVLIAATASEEVSFAFDEVIVAVGRRARLKGYGLEALGIDTDKPLVLDSALRTIYPNIHAVGDVAGSYQFTHVAAHQAWYAAVNALFGRFRTFHVDERVIPRVTYTDPEVASVGHGEASAAAAGIEVEIVRFELGHLDRAVADGVNRGFVKILVQRGSDRIVGATIVAAHAGETLAEIVLAMKHKLGLNKLLGTIHAYPTMAEANKYAAGEYKKANQPERLLRLVERYHRWRRG